MHYIWRDAGINSGFDDCKCSFTWRCIANICDCQISNWYLQFFICSTVKLLPSYERNVKSCHQPEGGCFPSGKTTSRRLTTWCSPHIWTIIVLLYQNYSRCLKTWMCCFVEDNKMIHNISLMWIWQQTLANEKICYIIIALKFWIDWFKNMYVWNWMIVIFAQIVYFVEIKII